MGIGTKILNKAKQYNESFVSTAQKDLNALTADRFPKVKEGLEFLGLPSNALDQRISEGLTDLLSGTLGIRTSNVPEVDVIGNKEAARAARLKALKPAARAEATPAGSEIYQFPRQYFNERERSEPVGSDDIVRFPNSMHFRSLKRKKQDHSEGLIKGTGDAGSPTARYSNNELLLKAGMSSDAGSHGSVNPASEPVYDIFLYLPPQLADSMKVSYTEGEAGVMEAMFAKLFTTGNDDDQVKDMTGGNNVDMGELMKMFKSVLPGAKIIQSATGNMINPMKFQTLENVTFRTYSYKFTMKPTTKDEALEIRNIVTAFRHSMLPGVAGENDRIWTFPNEWAIKFVGPISDWVDFPLTCVCTGCDVDYGGGGSVTMMEDGAPASIDLTLEFAETSQLNRQRYAREVAPSTDRKQVEGTVLNQSSVATAAKIKRDAAREERNST